MVAALVVLAAVSCGDETTSSNAKQATESVRSHRLYATDPPGALQAETVVVGSFRDLLENRTVDGYVQKRYYSAADPLAAVLDVVRHARGTGASIEKIDCTERTAGVSGSFVVRGIRQGFGAGASPPAPDGDVLETGTTEAPAGARSFVTIQTTPFSEAPGERLRSPLSIACPPKRLSDDDVRTIVGTDSFVRTAG